MTTLEKIKAEIEETQKNTIDWSRSAGLIDALEIIDKYAEQEPCDELSQECVEPTQKHVGNAFKMRCDDVVSRQAVLEKAINVPIAKVMTDELLEYCKVIYHKVVFVNDIEKLPPVTPQLKTGHWIKSRDSYGNHHFTCSECGNDIATQYADNWEDKYCSECGAKMVEQQESKESDHKCHTCKHYTSGDHDGSCGSYICKGYSNWESEEKE